MSNQNEPVVPEPAPTPSLDRVAPEPVPEPIASESGQTNSGSPGEADRVLEDLRLIMQVVGAEYEGEQRIDVANEVSDSVRFAQAAMPWRERISENALLKFHFAYEHLPAVEGQVLWMAAQFFCVTTQNYEYLINFDHVMSVSGLPTFGLAFQPSAITSQMDSVWLSGLFENQQSASWYLASDVVLVGSCTRLGLDAIDLRVDSDDITLMLKQLVAVRIPRQG